MEDIDITLFADENEKYGRENARLSLKVYFFILLICISFFVLLVCITKFIIMQGAYTPDNKQFFYALGAGFVLSLGIYILFGKKIIVANTEDKYKEFASVDFDWSAKNYNKFFKFITNIGGVVLCIFSLILGLVSTNDIGFYDDCFKESLALVSSRYDYEDINIYLIEGYTSDNIYEKYDGNNYVLEYADEMYYCFPEFDEKSEQDEFIKGIAKQYNKQIIHCKDDSVIYN